MIFLIFWHLFAYGWGLSIADVSIGTRFGLLTVSLVELAIEIIIVGGFIISYLDTKAEEKRQKRLQELRNAHV